MVYVAHDCEDEGDVFTGSRVCRKCKTRRGMGDFYWSKRGKSRSRSCKFCWLARSKESKARRDPVEAQALDFESRLRRIYGITVSDYESLVAAQNGCCAICRTPIDRSTTHIDHCHESDQVRGLLCFLCNTAIGKFRDDPVNLRAAADYLERPLPRLDGRSKRLTQQEAGVKRRAARQKAAATWRPEFAKGEENGAAKISNEVAEIIRVRYAKGGISQRALGEEYGVCQTLISQIVLRKIRTES